MAGVFFFYAALKLQREDIQLQRDDFQLQLDVMKKQQEEAENQRKIMALQQRDLKRQRKISEKQAFEVTYFNLLERLKLKVDESWDDYTPDPLKRYAEIHLKFPTNRSYYTSEFRDNKYDFKKLLIEIEDEIIAAVLGDPLKYTSALVQKHFLLLFVLYKYIVDNGYDEPYYSIIDAELPSSFLRYCLYSAYVLRGNEYQMLIENKIPVQYKNLYFEKHAKLFTRLTN
ncbi:hypothetical protein [Desulfovibrio sp. JC022]|uniref:hypothetical protein n=1 Tax=Desulfovibrio sp. JC022 TaxID=2593642 RepID=UPI0013D803B2|nr:hypothetical protein [Desulfovibrio sp. JC022]NDV24764.1 hypothetical protein [Desulfovibrio sp. JC022]